MPTDNYIDLSMRNHSSRVDPIYYGRFLGEGQMVMAHSNFKWPNGVSYPQMMKARDREVFALVEARIKWKQGLDYDDD